MTSKLRDGERCPWCGNREGIEHEDTTEHGIRTVVYTCPECDGDWVGEGEDEDDE